MKVKKQIIVARSTMTETAHKQCDIFGFRVLAGNWIML